jgi:hypothetical protein
MACSSSNRIMDLNLRVHFAHNNLDALYCHTPGNRREGTEMQTFTFLSTSRGNIQQANTNLFYYHHSIRPLIIGNQSASLTIR